MSDSFWFKSGSHRAEVQMKQGYTLGDVYETGDRLAAEWGVNPGTITHGLLSTGDLEVNAADE